MDDKELLRFAKDVYEGKVFTTAHLRKGDEQLLPSIFMPLVFMKDEERDSYLCQAAMLYEYYDQAMPGSINGYPMFTSVRMLSKEHYKRFVEHYNAIVNAMAKLGLDEPAVSENETVESKDRNDLI